MRLSPVVQSLTEPLLSPLVSAITGASGSGFSPRSLFADGSKGVVYDNNDFVDSATWRRNLFTYSEQFDNAVWVKANATITANTVIAPDGTLTGDKLVETATTGVHRLEQTITAVSGALYTLTVYAKAAERQWLYLFEDSGSGFSTFNLSTGVVGTTGGSATTQITPVGNGWYRCSLTVTQNGTIGRYRVAMANSTTGTSYTGDGTSGLLIWGAQLETGASATTYQRITDFNSDFLAAFPNTTMFLDSAGTTPATVNGLVGLQLDKSANLALGAEIKSSGAIGLVGAATVATYNTSTGDGTATRVDASNQSFVNWTGLATGSWYLLTIQNTGANTLLVRSGASGGVPWLNVFTGETKTLYVPEGSGIVSVTSAVVGSVQFTVSTIKQAQGNHRYQTTTGSKPVLRGTPTGANLVTNGDFATDTVWNKGTGWTIGSGVGTKTAGTASGLDQSYAFTVGKVYRCTYTLTVTAGSFQLAFTGGTTTSGALRSASGTYVEYLTAQTGNNAIYLFGTAAFAGTIDNVEIVDVSAGQVTAPYGLQYDGVDDFMQTAAVDFATATSDGLARRNLLTFPSAFDNAAWTSAAVGSVAVANQVAAPDGTLTADLLREDTSTGNHYNSQSPTVTNTAHTFSVYYKIASGTRKLALYNANTNVGRQFDATGVISAGVFNTPAGGFGVEAIGNGWYRAWITTTPAAGSGAWRLWLVTSADALSYTGDGASGFYVWGAQLEAGSTPSAFQDIGTDKMFVCAGVRKLSDAASGVVVELTPSVDSNTNSFNMAAPYGAAATFGFQSRGSGSVAVASASGSPAPALAVITGVGEIATDTSVLRKNGTQVASSVTDQGTGNYANAVLYFGRRNGTSLPYNGLDFGFVICGKTLTSTQIANTERWMSYRTGVTL